MLNLDLLCKKTKQRSIGGSMRKYWLFVLAVVFMATLGASRVELIAYEETFDGDISEWHHYDGAESPNNWHIHDFGGAQGDVWWMGDPALASGGHPGGYYNRQYLVLDTPAQTLTAANATLTFKMRLGLEDPAPHDDYDGWDSANVRLSTDGGTTWQVIQGTPPYHFTSSYAFGNIHGEGLGIPGWGGIHTDWISASFDLSSYVGQSVKIRFAFGSDPAYNTSDNPALFGFMVDDISFGGYTNNGVDDGQMVASSMVPLGGDLWHLSQEADAPSQPYAMKNQNAQGTYNQNMMNYLVSPVITLPSAGEIKADFMIKGDFQDAGTFPDTAYFGWEISPDAGLTWNAMSNPYADPDGTNYVYSDAPDFWASMVESYSLDGYVTEYAGQDVRFRWYFQSTGHQPQGTGIMIDNFRIYNEIHIAVPSDLTADVDGSSVELNWTAAGGGGGGGEEGWLSYDSGFNGGNAIGTNSESDFDVAIKWDSYGDENSIYPYVGMNVTKIKFFPNEPQCEYSIRLYTGGGLQVVFDQLVPNVTIGQWNEVTLNTPYTIPSGTNFAAGYRCDTMTGHPAGIDDTPAVNGYGNMIKLGGWSSLLDLADIDGNWNLAMYVEDANGREYVVSNLPIENESYASAPLQKVKTRYAERNTPNSYNIYRDGIAIGEVEGTQTTFTDLNVETGLHSYYVTAIFDIHESEPSNTAYAFIIGDESTVLAHDDGTSETDITVGSNRQLAVKFDTPDERNATLQYAAVYIHTLNTSAIMLRVFEVGPTGMPGGQLAQIQYPAANVAPGWNYIPFTQPLTITGGEFFLGVLEVPGASFIGLDTDNSGHAYINPGGQWQAYDEGEIMIRAIVELAVDNQDEVAPVIVLDATNYPNPFNPHTTIAYSVPESGLTSVKIYNLKGQMVNTLVNKEMESGNHSIAWNGLDHSGKAVSSGIYFLKVENNGKAIRRKILLSK